MTESEIGIDIRTIASLSPKKSSCFHPVISLRIVLPFYALMIYTLTIYLLSEIPLRS